MLNEKKIKLMTKLATYEQGKGKKDLKMSKYLRSDYISLNMVKSLIGITIAFIVLLAVWVLYNLETLIEQISKLDFIGVGTRILTMYVIFLGTFAFISYIVYSVKFKFTRDHLKDYNANLKQLETIHIKEGKAMEEIEAGGKDDYDDSFDN